MATPQTIVMDVLQYTNVNHASNGSAVRPESRTRIGALLSLAQREASSGHSILRDSRIDPSGSRIAIEPGSSAGRSWRNRPLRTEEAITHQKIRENSGS